MTSISLSLNYYVLILFSPENDPSILYIITLLWRIVLRCIIIVNNTYVYTGNTCTLSCIVINIVADPPKKNNKIHSTLSEANCYYYFTTLQCYTHIIYYIGTTNKRPSLRLVRVRLVLMRSMGDDFFFRKSLYPPWNGREDLLDLLDCETIIENACIVYYILCTHYVWI